MESAQIGIVKKHRKQWNAQTENNRKRERETSVTEFKYIGLDEL